MVFSNAAAVSSQVSLFTHGNKLSRKKMNKQGKHDLKTLSGEEGHSLKSDLCCKAETR